VRNSTESRTVLVRRAWRRHFSDSPAVGFLVVACAAHSTHCTLTLWTQCMGLPARQAHCASAPACSTRHSLHWERRREARQSWTLSVSCCSGHQAWTRLDSQLSVAADTSSAAVDRCRRVTAGWYVYSVTGTVLRTSTYTVPKHTVPVEQSDPRWPRRKGPGRGKRV